MPTLEISSIDELQKLLRNPAIQVLIFASSPAKPCRTIAPVFDSLSAQYAPDVTFAHFDVDEAPDLAQELAVQKVPAYYFFRGEELVDKDTGSGLEGLMERCVKTHQE